jgi:ATP-dependent DNA helicase RecG
MSDLTQHLEYSLASSRGGSRGPPFDDGSEVPPNLLGQGEFDFNAPAESLLQLWTPEDIFRSATAETINLFKEDNRVERKPPGVQPRLLGDLLSMWANTQPHGGVILIGVEDDGQISGCKHLETEYLNKLEQIRDYCPDARYEVKRIPATNKRSQEDFVIFVRVFYREDKLVETTSNEAFIRIGDQKRKLTEDEKREIRISKGEVRYELEPVPLRWPMDFDMGLTDQLVQSYLTKRNMANAYTREEVLSRLHLGKGRGNQFQPNLACALVLATSPRDILPGARLRISRYTGTEELFGEKLNKVFDDFADGPLPHQIMQADTLIFPLIQNFLRLGRDNKFYTRPEYPHELWYESIVNACAHRSYNLRNMVTFIKVFDDRFVVESPGGFLHPTTPATVYDAHNPRNPYTMEALFYLDIVHCGTEGTRRMRASMREANLPVPEFAQIGSQHNPHVVRVTLKNNFEHRKVYLVQSAADSIGEAIFSTLTEHEKLLLNYLSERGNISVSDAVRLTHRDWSSCKKLLEKLVSDKILVRQQSSNDPRNGTKRYVMRKRIPPRGQTT